LHYFWTAQSQCLEAMAVENRRDWGDGADANDSNCQRPF